MSKRSCMRWDKRDRLQGCLVLKRRLLFDYYRKKPRRHCTAMPPGFSYQTLQIYLKPTKPLGPNGFSFDRLMTPTL